MLPIEWRVGARNDLVQIIGFIARENPAAARRLRELIDAATIPLAEHPYLFRRSDWVPGTREVVCIPTM
ncbi:type II toxin-antitoxin system RelE/ParE family toxin [Trinickia sp. Y13]|uniref:type II toxin-antitoxin system RelE/ParE family toxin n=1 Tax=Trinickia sp. Y13 TaxID=2917807 RepID=UPI002405DA24|nr:type II toxin-antitoxin system RelE/ParE family toxin [Trinickia sp. Y13]MDG0023409.1 type II toxin-antitoxin system RelE/ParE family toxin [Trinickia sp. Y13]